MSARSAPFFTGLISTFAQPEPEGLLVYHEPLASYAESVEYQSFRQENALYSSVVTMSGQRKKLKAGAVVALLPYPPPTFDATFSERAQARLRQIEQVQATYPQVKPQLQIAWGKWTRAVAVFRQNQGISKAAPTPSTPPATVDLPLGAQLTSATAASATGRGALAFLSSKLGIPDSTFSVWMFFIVLPAVILGLLITILFTSRGQRVTALPKPRLSS